ncbi:MAG: DUF305 domain-containing protein [Micrococcus sp.]|nr:DUF305 domain-containing protein [Micrococcus sp.]
MNTRISPTTVLAGSALAAALVLTGCTTGDTDTSPSPTATTGESTPATAGTGTATGASPEASGTSTATGATAEANQADHRFARMMIPHHQQAIEMSDIILAKEGLDPEVATLAEEIKAAQGPEIEKMKSWLEEWGVGGGMGPGSDGSMGPGMGQESMGPGMGQGSMSPGMGPGGSGGMMGGMLSPQELEEMRQADTEEATRLFLEGMIGHHEGAIDMAEQEVQNGQYPDAVALAKSIIETQQREIETMRELLGQ